MPFLRIRRKNYWRLKRNKGIEIEERETETEMNLKIKRNWKRKVEDQWEKRSLTVG
jgi:hypothetical protein